jgi:APA family basic amino acid/polyamine antiporter
MARKIPGLARVLGGASIASVAYGEIGSSLYFALGVVALQALGAAPWILLVVGLLFLLVALSYAEVAAAIRETGGGATFVRRAFNDPAGFVVGWALFLDYLIVIALAALFVPHYLGTTVGWEELTDAPWDVVVAVVVAVALAAFRLLRRANLYRLAVGVAAVALVSNVVIIVLGFALLASSRGLGAGVQLGSAPSWSSLVFSLSLAMLAYTGLETVSNFAAETREPGRMLPRGLFAGIAAVVAVSVLVSVVGLSAYPVHPDPRGPGGFSTDLGTDWLQAPVVGIAEAFGGELPAAAVDAVRVFLGVTAVVILLAAASTSISGAGRLAYSLGQHGMLPHALGRLNRRTLIAPASIVAAAAIACALLVAGDLVGDGVRFLGSLYSFGVLIAFTAAQLAVIRLRFTEPELERPFRPRGNVRVRGVDVPLAALVGAPLTFALWIGAMVTHDAARIAGPIWLVLGGVIFVAVRRSTGEGLLERVKPVEPDLVPTPEGTCELEALHVIRVPFERPLDAELPEQDDAARSSLEEARTLAEEHGVEIRTRTVRARSIGEAIVDEAREGAFDLIVVGSSPRWRRPSRFFSPTVDHVLRRTSCQVMVVTFPRGVFDVVE